MKFLFLSFLIATGFHPVHAQEYYLLVGTYDSPKSEGVYVYKFNSSDGSAKAVSHIKTSNPSFITVSPDEKFVYAVHEKGNNGMGGEIAAFSFNKSTGTLTFLNQQLTEGDHPCHVEIDKTGKWVFAGNYTSGNLSVLPVLADGSLGTSRSTHQHLGSGKDPQRQKGPHVHSAILSADNKWLFVPDLGVDRVMIYTFDAANGELEPTIQQFAASDPGSGPRHFTFHPNHKFAYLIEELSGTVVFYKYKKGVLTRKQKISTMPAGDTGFAGSADIHVSPDGKFLYASNRGDANTIAIYRIRKDGTLRLAGHQSTLGKTPRNFNFDPSGKFLLAGNQNSDEIVIFTRNTTTGLLSDSGQRISVGKPVCIKWISTK